VTAGQVLHRAFTERADGMPKNGQPLIGLFGDGVPYPLIQAAGALCADVKAPPLADAENGPQSKAIEQIAEPFLDDFTTRFLHRFATGAFDHFQALVFARDDVAGLAAYLYASEIRRQGIVASDGPVLHLWNLIHTDTPAAHRFNLNELARLNAMLAKLGLRADDEAVKEAIATEAARRTAVDALTSGTVETFIYREAGRWLSPEAHISALKAVQANPVSNAGPAFGIVGTACDSAVLRTICSDIGAIKADLMPYGQDWGFDLEGVVDAETLIRAIAVHPLHIRANPPQKFGQELMSRLSGCDIVISAVDRNDDSFGWEVPLLSQKLRDEGVKFIDLGFMPFRPDDAWIVEAKTKITGALQ